MQDRPSHPDSSSGSVVHPAGSVTDAEVEESATVINSSSETNGTVSRGGMSEVGIVLALLVLSLVVALLLRIFT